jgi:hypothetical protein
MFENGQLVWIAGMDRYGAHTKKARKAIFKRYTSNDCCIVTLADVKFRKNGIDSCGITCLVSNISARGAN